MKHAAYGCLLLLVGWVVAAAAVAALLWYGYGIGPRDSVFVAVGAGLALWSAWGLLFSVVRRLRERAAVMAALAGRPPREGAGAVVVGTLQAQGPLLPAPFGGADCAAYAYRIERHYRVSEGGQRLQLLFEGIGLTPCVIATASGYFRLLTAAELDVDTHPPAPATQEAVQRYLRATTFLRGSDVARELQRRREDADGAYRSDVAYAEIDDVPWGRCQYRQHLLPDRAPVCVIGRFSAEHRGFVPSPPWRPATRLYAGSGETLIVRLRREALLYLGIAVAITAVAVAFTAAYVAGRA
ncbi:hypothetical protein ACFJIW_11720 [Tahibacter sp. UC22_41]|uniref:hypothetical protein n=1 Tax=Tahibacter sp. UC22_41 TaxID=3350178 RepID=UPI0036D966DE